MTREDKLRAFEMRLDGMTLQQIADRFGVTRQYIELIFKPERKRRKPKENFKCIYPRLKAWMIEHNVSVMTMYDELHIYDTCQTLYRVFRGEGKLNVDGIKKILAYTGMTFEEAFGEVVDVSGGVPDGCEQQAERCAV